MQAVKVVKEMNNKIISKGQWCSFVGSIFTCFNDYDIGQRVLQACSKDQQALSKYVANIHEDLLFLLS